MRLKDAAGWNQTERDWRNVMAVEPEGCFGIDCESTLAATATAVRFGRDLAWIGMVLTHPEYRRRGLARRLMEHAIEYLEREGVEWIKLDATDMGRPLYERLGFVEECGVERWARPPGEGEGVELAGDKELPLDLDREAFGACRAPLLRLLAGSGAVATHREGYAMGRAGSKAAYFGPSVARRPETARDLLGWFLSRHAGETVYWDLLPGNAGAKRLAEESGFAPLRRLSRMARPGTPDARPFARNDCCIFAIAGFEYG